MLNFETEKEEAIQILDLDKKYSKALRLELTDPLTLKGFFIFFLFLSLNFDLRSGGGAGRLNWSSCSRSFWCSLEGTRWILSCESYGPFLGQSFQLAERPRIIARSLFRSMLSLLLSSEPLNGCWSCDVNPESCDVVDSLYSVCSFAILFKTPFFKLISSPSLTLPKISNKIFGSRLNHGRVGRPRQ